MENNKIHKFNNFTIEFSPISMKIIWLNLNETNYILLDCIEAISTHENELFVYTKKGLAIKMSINKLNSHKEIVKIAELIENKLYDFQMQLLKSMFGMNEGIQLNEKSDKKKKKN